MDENCENVLLRDMTCLLTLSKLLGVQNPPNLNQVFLKKRVEKLNLEMKEIMKHMNQLLPQIEGRWITK